MNEELIAPCGMNCGVCSGYLAYGNDIKSRGMRMTYCKGCRPRDMKCAFLKKRCDLLMNGRIKYFFECDDFPCLNLQHIDKRYRTLYRMSMIENLEFIKKEGIEAFVDKETEKWKSLECGSVICCHNGICYSCRVGKLRNMKNMYRWEDD